MKCFFFFWMMAVSIKDRGNWTHQPTFKVLLWISPKLEFIGKTFWNRIISTALSERHILLDRSIPWALANYWALNSENDGNLLLLAIANVNVSHWIDSIMDHTLNHFQNQIQSTTNPIKNAKKCLDHVLSGRIVLKFGWIKIITK